MNQIQLSHREEQIRKDQFSFLSIKEEGISLLVLGGEVMSDDRGRRPFLFLMAEELERERERG
jgi:hypothetical protein